MLTTPDSLLSSCETRDEKDLLGIGKVPACALYGIHSARAVENFPIAQRPVHSALTHAFGFVKGASAKTNRMLGVWANDSAKADAIETACEEMAKGLLDDHIVVDALQGGAGTSTNMNVNEVIANRALQLLGVPLGSYDRVAPLDDINLHQSTNDAYPTALKLSLIMQLRALRTSAAALQASFRAKEKLFASVVKIGRTQLQDAVLTTLGREMKAYAEALGRDLTRLAKCEESLCVVNLGGTAIGTGIAAPIGYIAQAADTLHKMTGIDFVRAEDLIDNTQNADVFVEVSGALKTCASNMIKISTDLRLMSSGPDAGLGDITLPPRQAGSSIMPGKVNPVIPEAMTQAALRMIAYDHSVTLCASMGNLELNAFLPLVADCLLDGIDIMARAMDSLRKFCIENIKVNEKRCQANVESSTAILTTLVAQIGYSNAVKIVHDAEEQGKTVRQVVIEQGYMRQEAFDDMISPESVLRSGSSVSYPTGQ